MGDGCVSSFGMTGGVVTQFQKPANSFQAMKDVGTAAAGVLKAQGTNDKGAISNALGNLSAALTKLGQCGQAATMDAAQKAVNSGQAISPAAQQIIGNYAKTFGPTASAAPAPTQPTWGHSGVSSFG